MNIITKTRYVHLIRDSQVCSVSFQVWQGSIIKVRKDKQVGDHSIICIFVDYAFMIMGTATACFIPK